MPHKLGTAKRLAVAKSSDQKQGTICHIPLSSTASNHTPDVQGPVSLSEASVERRSILEGQK